MVWSLSWGKGEVGGQPQRDEQAEGELVQLFKQSRSQAAALIATAQLSSRLTLMSSL